MNNEPRTILDRVDVTIARELTPEPPPNRALDEKREALNDDLVTAWNDSFGADPLIDKALKDVRQRSIEAQAVIEDVAASRAEVIAGRSNKDKVEAEVAATLKREEAETKLTVAAARRAVEVGRDRLVRELLPEPIRGTTSSEAKGDLQLILAGFEDPADGFRHAVAQAVKADDRVALGLLAGSFGETLFRAKGGKSETYSGLRLELLHLAAEAAEKRSPRSTEARKWRVAMTDPASRYINGEGIRTQLRLQDIPR